MKKILCHQCNHQVEELNKFCPLCGTPVKIIPDEIQKCIKCNHNNTVEASFCENCGSSLKKNNSSSNSKTGNEPKTFQSTGKYAGTMIKGKGSKSWQRFKYAIITAVLVIIIALIIWFQIDSNAGEKLKTFVGGFIVIAIFLFIIFKKNKKRRRTGGGFRGGNRNDNEYEDDQYDDDDYDDYDDGGDDD